MNVIISKDDLRKLLEVAESHQDEGPPGEGWKSDQLEALIDRVSAVLGPDDKDSEGSFAR